jgi:HlyD family secretion protein
MEFETMKKMVQIIIIVVLALSISACGLKNPLSQANSPALGETANSTPNNLALITEGTLVPRDSVWLSFGLEGVVSELLVEEGDSVAAGQPLLRLGERSALDAKATAAQLQVLQAEQALETLQNKADLVANQRWQDVITAENQVWAAQNRLDELDTDAYRDRIDTAWVAVSDADDAVDDAQEELDKYKALAEDNATRKNAETALENAQKTYDGKYEEYVILKNDLELARAELAAAEAQQVEAERLFKAAGNGPDEADLLLAQRTLENAQAQLDAVEADLAKLELKAPFAGTVTRVSVTDGQRVTPTQQVLQIADFSEWYVETSDLTELDVVDVKKDQAVFTTPDALPALTLEGVVERIGDGYAIQSGDVMYTVRIRLLEIDPQLKWGMTVGVEFGN